MQRIIFSALRSWKEQAARKPLLIRGARQVGKTWVVRELGKLFKNFHFFRRDSGRAESDSGASIFLRIASRTTRDCSRIAARF